MGRHLVECDLETQHRQTIIGKHNKEGK